jgi:hypothetical protein
MAKTDSKAGKQRAVPPIAEREKVLVELEYVFPESVSAHSVNQFVIQYDKGQYRLSFFDIRPPMAIGTEDEQLEMLRKIGKVQAQCRAEVVISESRLPELLLAVAENLRNTAPDRFAEVEDSLREKPESRKTKNAASNG